MSSPNDTQLAATDTKTGLSAALAQNAGSFVGLILPVAIILALTIWPTITGKDITRESIFTIMLSIALASSLNILLGYTGYVSFGHVVFFGLGGYVGFYLMAVQGWSLSVSYTHLTLPTSDLG